jgi:hypothetical protein
MHVPLGMFEMNEMIGQSMVTQLHSLLEKFGLLHIVFDFVKIEGINLVAMATTVHFIIDYDLLKSFRVYEGTWFGHVMSKACQSNTNDNKVSTRLQHVNVKDARIGLQKTIT